ncbi:MAG TPA: hypothetical protein VGH32_08175, partial [Pirellulales bacterium]
IQLGKLALCQLSYAREEGSTTPAHCFEPAIGFVLILALPIGRVHRLEIPGAGGLKINQAAVAGSGRPAIFRLTTKFTEDTKKGVKSLRALRDLRG